MSLGDRDCLSESIQLDLFQTVNVKLETPKRIETLFPQLCDQFRIRNNYAKYFQGFKTRISAKTTALILVLYINKFIFDRPLIISKIK